MGPTSSDRVAQAAEPRRPENGLSIEIARTYTFDASHQLAWHPGKCSRLHGHTYQLDVVVGGPLNQYGVIMDFDDMDQTVRTRVLDVFDHMHLNDVVDNPTVENLVINVWDRLRDPLPLTEVTLWESRRSWARLRS